MWTASTKSRSGAPPVAWPASGRRPRFGAPAPACKPARGASARAGHRVVREHTGTHRLLCTAPGWPAQDQRAAGRRGAAQPAPAPRRAGQPGPAGHRAGGAAGLADAQGARGRGLGWLGWRVRGWAAWRATAGRAGCATRRTRLTRRRRAPRAAPPPMARRSPGAAWARCRWRSPSTASTCWPPRAPTRSPGAACGARWAPATLRLRLPAVPARGSAALLPPGCPHGQASRPAFQLASALCLPVLPLRKPQRRSPHHTHTRRATSSPASSWPSGSAWRRRRSAGPRSWRRQRSSARSWRPRGRARACGVRGAAPLGGVAGLQLA